MSFLKTTLLAAGVIFSGLYLYEKIFVSYDHAELISTKEKYVQLTKEVAQLETKYSKAKKIQAKTIQIFKEIRGKDLKKIKQLSDATFLLKKKIIKSDKSDYSFSTKSGKRGYHFMELFLSGPGSPPVGYILIKKDGSVIKRNYKSKFAAITAQTLDEKTGKSKTFFKINYTLKEKSPLAKRIKGYTDWQNKPYGLEIIDGTTLIDPIRRSKPSHFIVKPRFSLSLLAQTTGFDPVVGLGIFHIGKSANDTSMTFLEIGGNDKLLYIAPIKIRISNYLSNTKIGIQGNISKSGFNAGLIFSVDF